MTIWCIARVLRKPHYEDIAENCGLWNRGAESGGEVGGSWTLDQILALQLALIELGPDCEHATRQNEIRDLWNHGEEGESAGNRSLKGGNARNGMRVQGRDA